MAYQKGDTISAADINGFLTTVRNVYGVGSGNRGYGQTAITQAAVSAGDTITSTHWTNLRSMINTCATHQGTATSLLPGAGLLASGATVTAHESSAPSSNAFDLDTVVTSIDTNRLTAAIGGMTLASVGTTATLGTSWFGIVDWVIDAVWADEDAARYFFNSGGQFRMTIAHPDTSTGQNASWNSILSTLVGTVSLAAEATTRTGTGGFVTGIGFYELTDVDQIIYNGFNIGSGAYAVNDVYINARRLNYAGVNGGNGTGVRFSITLRDQYADAGDAVAAGTNVSFQTLRATFLSGLANPTVTTVSQTSA